MGTNRYGRRASRRESLIVIAVMSLAGQVAFGGLSGTTAAQPNPPASLSSNSLSLPTKIVTTDGKVFAGVRLLKVQPDGLLVEYRPDTGGTGLAKLKFTKLPESLQKQFGYDPLKASAFEGAQAHAMVALSQQMQQDEKAQTAMLNDLSQRPNVNGTVSVNSSDPTVTYAYYPPGQKPLEVGEYTAVTEPHFTCHADFTFHSQPGAPGKPIRLFVDTVTITLGLSDRIVEPQHPFDFVNRHEEGHRRINEYFYRAGPRVANDIGKSVVGQEFESSKTDLDAATAEVLPGAQFLVESEYMSHIEEPSAAANRYYDQLNDPEGPHVDVDRAVQQAIAKYADQIDGSIQRSPEPIPVPRDPVFPPSGFQGASSSPN